MEQNNLQEQKKCIYADFFANNDIVAKCNNLNCPTCRSTSATKKVASCAKRLAKLDHPVGFRSFIIHLTEHTTGNELVEVKNAIQALVIKLRPYPVINYVYHGLTDLPHLNIGISSKWFLLETYVGSWDAETKTFAKAFFKPPTYTGVWFEKSLFNLSLPCIRKIEEGFIQHRDDHIGWLKYCLREGEMEDFYDPNEILRGSTGAAFRVKKGSNVNPGRVLGQIWSPKPPDEIIGG